MGEKMTLERVRTLISTAFRDSQLGMPVSLTHSEADSIIRAIDAHLATPAQTVDVEKVRAELLKGIGGYLEKHHPDNAISYDAMTDYMADKLAQAIGDKT